MESKQQTKIILCSDDGVPLRLPEECHCMQVDVPPEVLLQQIHALSKKVGLYRTIKVCFVEEPPEFDTANGKRF